MELDGIAQRMRDFIEHDLGMYVHVQHNGKGWSFFPVTTTGRVIGETRMVVLPGRNPVVFVDNRGYFSGREGMALATRFRNSLDVLDLTPEMRVETI